MPRFLLCMVCAGLAAGYDPAMASETPETQAIAAGSPARVVHPVVDSANVLTGSNLLDALRAGGLVLYMRHTETGAITEDCNASNLSVRGEQEAIRVGQALRKLKVPIGKILSSGICRVRQTARLLDAGDVEISDDLSNAPKRDGHDVHGARMRLLATPPPASSNLLLVSHMHAGNSIEQTIELAFGEVLVFRPDGLGRSVAVARIRVEDWASPFGIADAKGKFAVTSETPGK